MEDVKDVSVKECVNSNYLKPIRLHYTHNGKPRTWDIMMVHDSVAVVLFNTTRQKLIYVTQFRPAVYIGLVPKEDQVGSIDTTKYPAKLGLTLELCAGIVDKDKSLAEIAREEVLEECGYNVPLSSIKKITSYRSGVGHSSSLQTLFIAEVTDDMIVSSGGGNSDEGELIKVLEYSIEESKVMMLDESVVKPPSLMFALMWFFTEYLKQ